MEVYSSPTVYMVSPSRKKEAREAANRLRYGSPKLRDVLRDRCRSRIHEKRDARFQQGRNLVVETNKRIKDLLSVEFEKDLELQELIYAEMMSEMDDWLDEEMKYMSGLEEMTVICPMCQRCYLTQVRQREIGCECGCKFDGSLEELARDIQRAADTHVNCNSQFNFYSERANALNMICFDCDFFATIRP